MDANIKHWKRAAHRLWADAALDARAATRLLAEIADSSDIMLRAPAAQAMPSLRAALLKDAHRHSRDLARRRFGAVRDVLHSLNAPRFGKRRSGAEAPGPDERNRRLLGLPLGRRLNGPEIQQAYKRAAKTMPRDAGGSERAFHELSAARDALLRGGER